LSPERGLESPKKENVCERSRTHIGKQRGGKGARWGQTKDGTDIRQEKKKNTAVLGKFGKPTWVKDRGFHETRGGEDGNEIKPRC